MEKGQAVKPRGYLPAKVTTGKLNRFGELQVEFDGGVRRWFRPECLTIIAEKPPCP